MFNQRAWINYLNENALLEAKVKDVKKQYPQFTEMGWLDWFRQNIESTLGQKGVSKYLLWTMRELAHNYPITDGEVDEDLKEPGEVPDNTAVVEELLQAVFGFERNVQRMEEKDIYRLQAGQVQSAIEKIEQEDTQKQARAKKKEKAMAGSEIIYDDHGVFAVRPKTEGASCYYGRHTKWCISYTESRNYFNQYTEEGKGFVMVRISGLPEVFKAFHKIAVVFSQKYNTGDWEAEDAWDVLDNRHEIDVLYEALASTGIQKQIAAEIYQDIIDAGTHSMETEPPESGMEEKAEKILEEWNQANSPPDNFSAYYDVDSDGTRDYLMFGATYYFEILDDQLDEKEIPGGWGSEAQEFMDDIREALDQEANYYGVEEIEIESTGIQIRISSEGYDPNPDGFESFLGDQGIDTEKAIDIEKVLEDYLRKEGYMKHTPVSALQQQLRNEEENILSGIKGYHIHHNDYDGIYATGEKKYIVYNGDKVDAKDLPRGDEKVLIDMSDLLTDELPLDYIRSGVGSLTSRTLRILQRLSKTLEADLAKQMDLPISDLPKAASKAFDRKSIPNFRRHIGVESISVKGTGLGEHAIAFTVGFKLLNPPREELVPKIGGMEWGDAYIKAITKTVMYIENNEDIFITALKKAVAENINETEKAYAGISESVDNEVQDYFTQFTEEQDRSRQRGIYRFYCMIGYGIKQENRRGLEDILTDIRAIEHVTIVTVMVSNQRISDQQYVAGLAVKYTPSIRGEFNSPEEIKSRIVSKVKRIPGVKRLYKISAKIERIE